MNTCILKKKLKTQKKIKNFEKKKKIENLEILFYLGEIPRGNFKMF